jgi:probable rRNA maturation factor
MVINIENQNPRKKINLSEVRRVAFLAVKKVCRKECQVNIIFVTDRKIQALNRKYLGRDRVTDVLAFEGEDFPSIPGVCFLGDIAISSDRAGKNSKLYGVSYGEEISRYVVHGILHLGGHDDSSRTAREKMRKKEDEILQKSREKK